ncbi:hypothetical protein [Chryseobacterium vrystaatense]|nr:hypothetical protein [Chryseobacterium vrystaatense]
MARLTFEERNNSNYIKHSDVLFYLGRIISLPERNWESLLLKNLTDMYCY